MAPQKISNSPSNSRGHTRKRSALDAVGPEADEVKRTLGKVLNVLNTSGLADQLEEFTNLKNSVSNTRDSFAIIKEYHKVHIGLDIKVNCETYSLSP
jgi:hypothetical protein